MQAAPESTREYAGIVPRDAHEPITDDMWRQLRERWPNGERLKAAMRLAKDQETCAALLLGHPVDPSRINKDALERALEASLVQLVRPIDVLHGRAA